VHCTSHVVPVYLSFFPTVTFYGKLDNKSCLLASHLQVHSVKREKHKMQSSHSLSVSTIISLEAKEQAREILSSQATHLFWSQVKYGSAGLGVTELSRHPEKVHIYLLHIYFTEVGITLDRV